MRYTVKTKAQGRVTQDEGISTEFVQRGNKRRKLEKRAPRTFPVGRSLAEISRNLKLWSPWVLSNSDQGELYLYLTYLLHGAESFLRSQQVLSYSRNFPHFIEPEGSSPHSQQLAICSYPEPDRSSPCPHTTFWRSILILSYHLRLVLSNYLYHFMENCCVSCLFSESLSIILRPTDNCQFLTQPLLVTSFQWLNECNLLTQDTLTVIACLPIIRGRHVFVNVFMSNYRVEHDYFYGRKS